MAFDSCGNADKIRALGKTLVPETLQGSQAMFVPFHESEPYRNVYIERDIPYGGHERQKLDLFAPEEDGKQRATVIFVHGGGFVAGDKKRPGMPYQDNVALWAVRQGMIGITMNYRYAPASQWPSGAEDVGAVVIWARGHVADRGGDPNRIFVMGTSAGAVHVASYVTQTALHQDGAGIAGAIMLSGIYDLTIADKNLPLKLYFGEDAERYAERSTIDGLIETSIPWMAVLAEHDPPDFEKQALQLVSRYHARHGRWPNLIRLMGHNHFTASLHLNTPDDYLGRQLLDFMAQTKR